MQVDLPKILKRFNTALKQKTRAIKISYDARLIEEVENEPGFNFGWNSACEYIASKTQNDHPRNYE